MPRFRAVVETDEGTAGTAFVEVPVNVMAALGPRKRVPVRVTINGFTYRSTNSIYGGVAYLPLRADVRKAAGIEVGDRVAVDARSGPGVTQHRAAAGPGEGAWGRWDAEWFAALSPSHQKEYVLWLDDAKRPETRVRRLDKIVEKLREKLAP